MTSSDHPKVPPQAPVTGPSHGEAERDNDSNRPDGSTRTEHDSTAQRTARHKGEVPPPSTDERPAREAD